MLVLQLTYRDVVLDFFKDKKEILLKLRSGMKLSMDNYYLLAELNGRTVKIAKLSKACRERIERLQSNGYTPYSAEIRFIVSWRKEDADEEIPVILPDVQLKKDV